MKPDVQLKSNNVQEQLYASAPKFDMPVMQARSLGTTADRAQQMADRVLARYKLAIQMHVHNQQMQAQEAAQPSQSASNPFASDGAPSTGFNSKSSLSTPFAQPIQSTPDTYGPLLRAVEPGFDQLSKFGYNDTSGDFSRMPLVDMMRRLTRNANPIGTNRSMGTSSG